MLSDIPDSARIALPYIEMPVSVIQPDDILEIRISGKNEETVQDFNTKGSGYSATGSTSIQSSTPNYLVDKKGDIEMYKIGKVKASGLTIEQLKENLLALLDKEIMNPNVVIRFANLRFTVLGEVRTPSTYTIPNERLTILEAVGYAGDLTTYARRDIVRVIRDSSGHREIGTVNFTQKSLFTSPFFYLKRNDVVLVETDNKLRKTSDVLARTASIVGVISSLVTVAYLLIFGRR
ncbi:MAG: polysaccharide biosynthesis/export family protein [Chitinophagaceae bacterium]|nr:polysaccharide biosynthesis/export family protein [Chitinophagaceae bacterium]MCW5904877.1 polysaccharide biosynthesis/export family protein [Chitinophagaceae bacterium]